MFSIVWLSTFSKIKWTNDIKRVTHMILRLVLNQTLNPKIGNHNFKFHISKLAIKQTTELLNSIPSNIRIYHKKLLHFWYKLN